ncbi:MAG: EI24 domain-containing protein [Vicingaceae bacterium]
MLKELSPADQVFSAFRNTIKSFDQLKKLRLNWIYAVPLLLYLALFAMGIALTNDLHEMVIVQLEQWLGSAEHYDGIMSFLFTATSVLTWIIIKLTLFILFGILSGYLTLVALSPLLTYVSEKVAQNLTSSHTRLSVVKFFKDMFRAIIIAMRNATIQLGWTLLILILSFVPVVNLFAAPLLFLITAYFYGFSFIDYYLEINGFKLSESVVQVRRMKWLAISLGGLFLMLNMIPYFGTLLSSIFIFHLVTAATISMHEAPKEVFVTADKEELD